MQEQEAKTLRKLSSLARSSRMPASIEEFNRASCLSAFTRLPHPIKKDNHPPVPQGKILTLILVNIRAVESVEIDHDGESWLDTYGPPVRLAQNVRTLGSLDGAWREGRFERCTDAGGSESSTVSTHPCACHISRRCPSKIADPPPLQVAVARGLGAGGGGGHGGAAAGARVRPSGPGRDRVPNDGPGGPRHDCTERRAPAGALPSPHPFTLAPPFSFPPTSLTTRNGNAGVVRRRMVAGAGG